MIEMIAKLLGLAEAGANLAKPLVDRSIAEGPMKGRNERLEKWQDAMATNDAAERGERLHGLVAELCIAGGQLPGDVPNQRGPVVEVPLPHLNALFELGAQAVETKQYLVRAMNALGSAAQNR